MGPGTVASTVRHSCVARRIRAWCLRCRPCMSKIPLLGRECRLREPTPRKGVRFTKARPQATGVRKTRNRFLKGW